MYSVPWYSVLNLKAYFPAVFVSFFCVSLFKSYSKKRNPFHSLSDIRKTFHLLLSVKEWFDCRPYEIMHMYCECEESEKA